MSPFHQLLRGITAFACIIAVAVGLPIGLLQYVGSPIPTSWPDLPTSDEIGLFFRSEINPQTAIQVVAIVVWVLWAVFIGYVIAEVIALARGRTVRRSRFLPGFQTASARLVATTALIVTSLIPLRPAPVLADHTAAIAQTDLTPESSGQPKVRPVALTDTVLPVYRTQQRDTFWSIAETTLGDGLRWQQIRDLNLDRQSSDGQPITTATLQVPPGTTLLLPDDASTPNGSETPNTREYKVVAGDNFWNIAERTLLSEKSRAPDRTEIKTYWRALIAANTARLHEPGNPDLILPGQVLLLPHATSQVKDEAPSLRAWNNPDRLAGQAVVEAGDSFWTLAKKSLSASWNRTPTNQEIRPYWNEMIDLNLDELTQAGNPHHILAGQILRLPPLPPDPTSSPTNEPGDTPQAAQPKRVIPPTPTLPPDRPRQPEAPPQPTDSTVPAATEESTELESDRARPELTPDLEPADQSTPPPAADSDLDEFLPVAGWSAGLGILAAGIVGLLTRLRRVQLRQRGKLVPVELSLAATALEAPLREAAAEKATEFIDVALRAMSAQLNGQHPSIVGLEISNTELRLKLAPPNHDAPEEWGVEESGAAWTIPTSIDLTHLRLLADGAPHPYPSLVTVGHDYKRQLLIDLEQAGAIQVTGTPDEVTAACHTIAAELAVTRFAYFLQVICVGFGEDLAGLDRIEKVDSLDDILWLVEDTAEASIGVTQPTLGRIGPENGDAWNPLIVIDPATSPPSSAPRLFAAAKEHRPIVAMVGYPTPTEWKMNVTGGTITLEPHGATLSRRDLTSVEQTGLADLLAAAQALEEAPPSDLTDGATGRGWINGAPSETPHNANVTVASPQLEVKVLGHIRIEAAPDFPLTRSTELVSFLTLHRNGVDAHTLMEAIWPNQPPDKLRLNRHVSLTRTALGKDPDDKLYLPHLEDNLYRVSTHLACDLERFEDLLIAAGQTSLGKDERGALLQAALELVDNAPFTGVTRGFTWAYTEGVVTRTVLAIDETAHRLASIGLDTEDHALVAWASRKGLLAISGCEECYRNMMRSAGRQGNRAAVAALYKELEAVTYADDGPYETGWLDPETEQLYARLTAGNDSVRRR